MIKKTIIALSVFLGLTGAYGEQDSARAEAPPKRIVSFNLCADQLLLALADPSQIAGLSPYATDAALSVTTDQAAHFPRLDWDAESVVNLAPDLVLVGPSNRPTQAMLSAMGIRVAEVRFISNTAEAIQQAREIGRLIGHPDRGEAMARKLEEAETQLAAVALKPPMTALVVQRGGYSEGPASLVAGMLTTAGLRPPANSPSDLGGFGGYVSLEQLLVDGPDVLVLQDPPQTAGDQGALFITHPALLARYGANRRIDLPSRYTLCGGPPLIEGLDYLARAIKTLR
ncbi:ABC transporter substrate-binding protein [Bradyrhizobium sp. SYSU BS000235]|uniref:ABC transporter substrate-binding protein n=1 Tax=Bradyrhizobium sp. SYSU BS000235 TaxID=3411332 RepID=UPI003C73A2EA